MKKRILCLILAAALCGSLAAATGTDAAVQYPVTYTGKVLAAVNTDLSTKSLTNGTFTPQQEASSLLSALTESDQGELYGISDIVTDPVTGETMYLRSPEFEEIIPVEDATFSSIQGTLNEASFSYKVGDGCNVSDNNSAARPVQCLYIGQYCTVWGSTADPESVRITEALAKEIADAFDGYYSSIVNSFGTWYDADGDEKLAIFCYDIDKNAENDDRSSTYYGGFFHNIDLLDSNGYANGLYFGQKYFNGMTKDCIHLDTYPGMGGYDAPLSNVAKSFPTLMHETQHLINFSYQMLSGTWCGEIDTYLNEGFSMAAEHMICGSDTTASRVTYFNNSAKYVSGTSLTAWSTTLSNYANSYLFSQYLRTRYGQMTDTNGNTFFKTVLQTRQSRGGGDTLTIIAELLETTPKQLVLDFWTAVYTKASFGPYGFNRENWADAISANLSTDTSGIYNGGVKFYAVPEEGLTVQSATNVEFVELGDIIDSGSCGAEGDNLTWELTDTDNDGVGDRLTIDGVGAMEDYKIFASFVPFRNYISTIKTVTIGSGVTTIGDYAFYDFRLTSVTIPNSVTSIGRNAFEICSNLTSVTIPNSVVNIGDWAFNGCSRLTSVTIPDSVTSIGSSAFANCRNLTAIHVDANNPNYFSHDGVLFNKNKTTLIQYPCSKGGAYAIPDSVDSIGNYAFSLCNSLTSVTIPNSVVSIGDWAFSNCDDLTSVTIPNSVTSIGDRAFNGCSRLTSVTIPDSVTNVGSSAFASCTSLTAFVVSDGNTNYASVDGVIFSKDKTTLLMYPAGKQGAYTIPDSITSIGHSAFSGCSRLTSVAISNSVTSIGDNAFDSCTNLTTVVIPDSITTISNHAFAHCTSLTYVAIPDSVTSIGSYAFGRCTNLTSVTIGNSVTAIGQNAFSNCTSLTSVTIPDSVTSIGKDAFAACDSLTSAIIPDSVANIGNYAFYGCTSLTDVYYSGTEKQWNDITIGNSNESLLNANIHFSSFGGGHCAVENAELHWVVTAAENDGAKKLTITASQTEADTATAFLVIYSDKGQMLGITTATLTRGANGTLELALPKASKNPTSFKLLLLDGDSSPLTTAMGANLDGSTSPSAPSTPIVPSNPSIPGVDTPQDGEDLGGEYETDRDYT